MSWRNATRGGLAGILAILAGCGFKPVYGENSVTRAPTAMSEFSEIEIPPIEDRIGQEFRNMLIDDLHPHGAANGYRYRLAVQVREVDLNLGLQVNSTSTRGQVKLTIDYALSDNATGKTLLNETLRTSTGYNILVNQFGTVLSTEDARDRGLKLMSDELTQHLALYFERKTP